MFYSLRSKRFQHARLAVKVLCSITAAHHWPLGHCSAGVLFLAYIYRLRAVLSNVALLVRHLYFSVHKADCLNHCLWYHSCWLTLNTLLLWNGEPWTEVWALAVCLYLQTIIMFWHCALRLVFIIIFMFYFRFCVGGPISLLECSYLFHAIPIEKVFVWLFLSNYYYV